MDRAPTFRGGGAFAPRPRAPSQSAIVVVRSAGGVPRSVTSVVWGRRPVNNDWRDGVQTGALA